MTQTGTYHTHDAIPPVYDEHSRVLLLGTFPSPKSREYGFYYGHPQNRFWPVLTAVLGEPIPRTNDEKRALCLRRGIALWDVLASCRIVGASDTSIKDPIPNPISRILGAADIRAIFATGQKAGDLYRRLCLPDTGREAVTLPSTSPANCRRHTIETLTEAYRVILPHLV